LTAENYNHYDRTNLELSFYIIAKLLHILEGRLGYYSKLTINDVNIGISDSFTMPIHVRHQIIPSQNRLPSYFLWIQLQPHTTIIVRRARVSYSIYVSHQQLYQPNNKFFMSMVLMNARIVSRFINVMFYEFERDYFEKL